MSGHPFDNGRVVLPPSWARTDCGTPEPIEDEVAMGELVWRETARLVAIMVLGVVLLVAVYLLGWR